MSINMEFYNKYPRLYGTCTNLNIPEEVINEWFEKINNDAACFMVYEENVDTIQNVLKAILVRIEASSHFNGNIIDSLNNISTVFNNPDYHNKKYNMIGELVGFRQAIVFYAITR